MSDARISIVIVNYNTSQQVARLLQACAKELECGFAEAIVVDNASTDSAEVLSLGQMPNVRVCQNAKNGGFAAASNRGISLAKGNVISLANPDLIISPSTLHQLVELMERDRQLAIITPQILNSDGSVQHPLYTSNPGLFPSIASAPLLRQLCSRFTANGMSRSAGSRRVRVKHATGAFLTARRQVWENVGRLDSSMVLGFEDVDFCRRAAALGYSIVYVPEIAVVHEGGVSRKSNNDQALWMMTASKKVYFSKYYGVLGLLVLLLIEWGSWFLDSLHSILRRAREGSAEGNLAKRLHVLIVLSRQILGLQKTWH